MVVVVVRVVRCVLLLLLLLLLWLLWGRLLVGELVVGLGGGIWLRIVVRRRRKRVLLKRVLLMVLLLRLLLLCGHPASFHPTSTECHPHRCSSSFSCCCCSGSCFRSFVKRGRTKRCVLWCRMVRVGRREGRRVLELQWWLLLLLLASTTLRVQQAMAVDVLLLQGLLGGEGRGGGKMIRYVPSAAALPAAGTRLHEGGRVAHLKHASMEWLTKPLACGRFSKGCVCLKGRSGRRCVPLCACGVWWEGGRREMRGMPASSGLATDTTRPG